MIFLVFSFIASAIYVVKNGVGKEKVYFLYPLGSWIVFNIVFGILVAISPSLKESAGFILGIPMTILLVAMCFWIVAKVRKNSMDRVMNDLNSGTFKEQPNKKFEL